MLSLNHFIASVLFLILTLSSPSSQSANSHGQTAPSSDQVVEISERDLLGNWTCESYLNGSIYQQDKFVAGWNPDAEGLYVSLAGSKWTFADDGDGTYSVTTGRVQNFV